MRTAQIIVEIETVKKLNVYQKIFKIIWIYYLQNITKKTLAEFIASAGLFAPMNVPI